EILSQRESAGRSRGDGQCGKRNGPCKAPAYRSALSNRVLVDIVRYREYDLRDVIDHHSRIPPHLQHVVQRIERVIRVLRINTISGSKGADSSQCPGYDIKRRSHRSRLPCNARKWLPAEHAKVVYLVACWWRRNCYHCSAAHPERPHAANAGPSNELRLAGARPS